MVVRGRGDGLRGCCRCAAVECVVYGLLHCLKHFLNQVQERLNPVCERLGLVALKVHDGLHAQYRIVFILQLHQTHELVDYLGRMRFDGLGRVHGQSVQDFEDAVPYPLSLSQKAVLLLRISRSPVPATLI